MKQESLNSESIKDKEINRVSSVTIGAYGYDVLNSLMVDQLSVRERFQVRHSLTAAMRRKMVDWMVEVLATYDCCSSTFFRAVMIMDAYIDATTLDIQDKDVHLLGVTAMFMASKQEDLRMIDLRKVSIGICHGAFSQAEIKKKEKLILATIDLSWLLSPSPIDFLNTFLFDFLNNNAAQWDQLSSRETLLEFVKSCYFFAYLTCHFEEFSSLPKNIVAIACLTCGLDFFRSANAKKELAGFQLFEFVKFLMSSVGVERDEIKAVNNRIRECFEEYKVKPEIDKNLMKQEYTFAPTELAIFN